jgi:hypothetical protein
MEKSNINPRHALQYRSWLRLQAQAASHLPIAVVDGEASPVVVGESAQWTTPGGSPVRYPNAYRRAWGKPVYHCSTRRVVVGRQWLTARSIPVVALVAGGR